ncbi:tyrosine-protein phosphatase [Aquamicrobium sp. LC103]|uniref:tyrosine-protein phosphatase n=1 Tax=Aquamicrobium sp. LC103 TaxID=1120658 RepID=UPI00069C95DF|nr:tyrosine-protein phosphatase [Aquamicrobium sp. LC103]TKT78303.1 tyrosine-protein phosphatase [Aquamicrobium sp. LC103]
MTPYERHIRLDGAHNVRDLGGYATAAGGTTRWRSFLRADALHELNSDDIQMLLQLGLRTVIDLRSDGEIARQPSVFADHEEVRYHHVPLFDGLAPVDAMMTDTSGFDLAARYIEAADRCHPAIARVALTIAHAEKGIVLFNCTAGKDRTGIVAAMLLSLAGVDDDQIAADYAMTATIAGALMEKLKGHAVARGLDETVSSRLLASEPAAMLSFLRHMDERYGGFAAYLTDRVADADGIHIIRKRMLAGIAQPFANNR